ncbi:(2Fe-2S)-binding protein [Paracoccus sanguinis]|uniref:Isoquinoline 1-oxidoreductase, alpha subunit n=1 Tax=Paracoccus sanguinis TaxID=1545044 RepID=A0A1H3CMA2_9RHOB|nr:(2Fe-2S)-binding protein [Paracoccus sanguinis]KGJ16555.1 hypothetical protein IX57_11870 [Paracoccus sanguinis]SDX54569.1 isoquinoline 1-oxidoreductase, alpha subunit [Paracoccus sanguinis]
MHLSFLVNGAAQRLDVPDPEMPLVFILRDLLGLKGTKFSCLEGLCGACTVHLDGVAMRACLLRASDVEGRRVTTIEGLSADGDHPVQRAWLEERVAQCGWCQPGQIMQAAAFLAETPAPSPEDIAAAMDANLCRCGTGPRILRAVARAAGMAGEATR